jgi:hypothetical protein
MKTTDNMDKDKFVGIIATLLLILGLLLMVTDAKAACYSEGIRKGEIQKFSAKGWVNKSWEGEMVQDGLRRSKDGTLNIWKFSVTDSNVADKVVEAMRTGRLVMLTYCQSLIKNPLASNTPYIVTEATVVP